MNLTLKLTARVGPPPPRKVFEIIILPECTTEIIQPLTCAYFYKVEFRVNPADVRDGHPNQLLCSFVCSLIWECVLGLALW